MNVVISEGFRQGLRVLSKADRRHAWDGVDKLIESPNMHAGDLQMKKMKAFDVYEIRATLDLRILARRAGEDICCVRIGHHNKTLKARADGRLGEMPNVYRLRSLVTDTDGSRSRTVRPPVAPRDGERCIIRTYKAYHGGRFVFSSRMKDHN